MHSNQIMQTVSLREKPVAMPSIFGVGVMRAYRYVDIDTTTVCLANPVVYAHQITGNTFKSRRIDKHWLDQDVAHNIYFELTGTGGAPLCIDVVKNIRLFVRNHSGRRALGKDLRKSIF